MNQGIHRKSKLAIEAELELKDNAFKVPGNPEIFLSEMNICGAWRKQGAKFLILVKMAIFHLFVAKMEI